MKNNITVLVADDLELVREALMLTLSRNPEIMIVGEASDGMEAVKKCEELRPDVLIIDIKMPVLDGIRAAEKITSANPDTRVIVHTMYVEDTLVIEALQAGVSAFVLKSGHNRELIDAIYSVSDHKPYFSPGISPQLVEKLPQTLPH